MGMTQALNNRATEKGSAKQILFDLQVEQHHHDENYHREIARLSLHQRLNHMALHFCKYVGKVAAAETIEASMPVFVDTLVIALSTANILNIELYDALDGGDHDYAGLPVFGRALAHKLGTSIEGQAELINAMAIPAGKIAAACEKIDHLEDVAYRSEIKGGVACLAAISLALLSTNGADPADAVRSRLTSVKTRLKLHGWI